MRRLLLTGLVLSAYRANPLGFARRSRTELEQQVRTVGTAEWVARRVQDRDTDRDSRAELRMCFHNSTDNTAFLHGIVTVSLPDDVWK